MGDLEKAVLRRQFITLNTCTGKNNHLHSLKMAYKHIKRCLTLLVTKDLKIKTTMRYHCTSFRIRMIKHTHTHTHTKLQIPDKDAEQWELFSASVQFGRSVVSDSLRPHGSEHTRPPCVSPTPRVYPNSCPLSR